jgi:uncharacterized BrkB/YihY/UPF0761 family membrane protein
MHPLLEFYLLTMTWVLVLLIVAVVRNKKEPAAGFALGAILGGILFAVASWAARLTLDYFFG